MTIVLLSLKTLGERDLPHQKHGCFLDSITTDLRRCAAHADIPRSATLDTTVAALNLQQAFEGRLQTYMLRQLDNGPMSGQLGLERADRAVLHTLVTALVDAHVKCHDQPSRKLPTACDVRQTITCCLGLFHISSTPSWCYCLQKQAIGATSVTTRTYTSRRPAW